jgi:hypothetical protein
LDIGTLVKEIGVQAAIALILVLLLAQAIRMILRRNERDAETVRQTLVREQGRVDELDEEITEHGRERWTLIAERIKAEEALKACQEKLEDRGIGSMTLADEKVLRQMIVELQTSVMMKNREIAALQHRNSSDE